MLLLLSIENAKRREEKKKNNNKQKQNLFFNVPIFVFFFFWDDEEWRANQRNYEEKGEEITPLNVVGEREKDEKIYVWRTIEMFWFDRVEEDWFIQF